MRLAGGVADHRRAGRQRGGHQRVLGRHHRGLVHEHVGRAQPARRASARSRAPQSTLGAHRAERVEVRVQAPAADHVAARGAASPRGESARAAGRRAGTRRGSARRARARSRPRRTLGRAQRQLVGAAPVDRDADRARIVEHRLDVADARDVADDDLVLGQEAARARIGSAPFLFPAGPIVPDSGTPPSITNFSISRSLRRNLSPRGHVDVARGDAHVGLCKPNSHLPRPVRGRRGCDLHSGRPRPRRTPRHAARCNFRCKSASRIFGSSMRHFRHDASTRTHVRIDSVRGRAYLYEHMFPSANIISRPARARCAAPDPLVPPARGRLCRRLGGRQGRAIS